MFYRIIVYFVRFIRFREKSNGFGKSQHHSDPKKIESHSVKLNSIKKGKLVFIIISANSNKTMTNLTPCRHPLIDFTQNKKEYLSDHIYVCILVLKN